MIVLGLGTNMGDRLAYLKNAIRYLSKSVLNITAISPVYESPALLKPDAPEEWNINFLNLAIMGETNFAPQELLEQIKIIEKKVGRQDRGIWAPREIDIDILAYDNLILYEDNLQIPHIHLCERAFALLPFADISPDWHYPAKGEFNGKTACEIAKIFADGATMKTGLRVR